jgi:hypothetical protein
MWGESVFRERVAQFTVEAHDVVIGLGDHRLRDARHVRSQHDLDGNFSADGVIAERLVEGMFGFG